MVVPAFVVVQFPLVPILYFIWFGPDTVSLPAVIVAVRVVFALYQLFLPFGLAGLNVILGLFGLPVSLVNVSVVLALDWVPFSSTM